MLELFEANSRTEDELDAILKNYRTIALVCGVGVLVLGFVRAYVQPGGLDPLFERLAAATMAFVYAGLTCFDSPARRFPFMTVTVLASGMFAYSLHLAYLTNFSVNSAFASLLVLFAASLIMRTRTSLLLFQMATLTMTALLLVQMPNTAINPTFFMTIMTAVCIFTYISQAFRMRMEEHLRQSKTQALAAVEARTRFLANMSHEIRTPMNGVIGMTHLLEQTQLDETQHNYLKTIKVSGDTLLNIINDILDFSKVDAGELNLDLHDFDLIECLENTMDLVKQSCSDKDLDLNLIIEPQVPRHIHADSTRVRQIVINLLNNAIKFTEQGSVTLKVGGQIEGDRYKLRCQVTDTGIGISEEAIPHLFAAFAQADSSTTRKYGGTGLGLSITKHLIERMDGKISVTSKLDEGSSFEFYVMVRDCEQPDQNEAFSKLLEELKAQPNNMLVFVENEDTHASLTNFFSRHEIDIAAPETRTQAVSHLQHNGYELIFSDAIFTRDLNKSINLVQVATTNNQATEAHDEALFNLELPVKPSRLEEILLEHYQRSNPAEQTTKEKNLNPEQVRVLLAEDNFVNQQVATRMLEKYGFNVDLAKNGAEALDAIRNSEYDVILMDLQMPELSGIEVTQKVREEGEKCHIIALTANAFEEDRQACFTAGMNAYLSKPLRQEALDTEIRRALRH